MAVQPLTIRGAFIYGHQQRDLYTSDVVLDTPANGALTVDLDGYTIFPGLINAHDHLELNHYPRSKFRERYDNAHQWGEDMNARLDTEPYKSLRTYPLWDRLFIGGLKNLLCGATTVAHHNPPHKELWRKDFPVHVLKNYGWAHSLHFNTDEEVIRSYRATPKDWPWFIHLAEGTDEVAAGEYQRLKTLGCVGPNTVIVHGVAMTEEDIAHAAPRIRGLVWCPSTNAYLLKKTARIDLWVEYGGRFAFGSDSRLTADGDLMQESAPENEVYDILDFSPVPILEEIDEPLTWQAATILGCRSLGNLKTNAKADWFLVDFDLFRRTQIHLVVKGGIPQIGDPDVMAKFPHIETVDATLDGVPKRIHLDLARRIHQCSLKEPGLEVDTLPQGRKFWSRKG
ncbi:MAG: amidohydrolase family protein [Chloroflexi bacterium]|nr:amidohydrolase family protein [Chloroflexota bacterium]